MKKRGDRGRREKNAVKKKGRKMTHMKEDERKGTKIGMRNEAASKEGNFKRDKKMQRGSYEGGREKGNDEERGEKEDGSEAEKRR